MRWFSLRNMAVSTAVATALVGAMAQPAAACNVPTKHDNCSQEQLTVTAGTTTHTVRGELCTPKHATTAVTFVGGFSYKTSEYFDPAYAGGKYSQQRSVLDAGMATFTYDQLATGGASDNPIDTSALSLVTQTDVLYQITQWLHGKFSKVVVIGHSLGLQEAMLLANKYPSAVDAIAGFGYLRNGSPSASVAIGALRVPASQTTKYATAPWAVNSMTTKDGVENRAFFYNPNTSDPGMIAYDEANKGVSRSPPPFRRSCCVTPLAVPTTSPCQYSTALASSTPWAATASRG